MAKRQMKAKNTEIKRILLVRPDAVGDVVLTIPSILALKKTYPNVGITILGRSFVRELLGSHPAVDEIIVDQYAEGRIKGWRQSLAYVKEWRNGNYDAVIYFASSAKYVLTGFLAGIARRIGDRGKLLYNLFYTDGVFQAWNNPTKHTVELNLSLAGCLGADIASPELLLYPAKEALAYAQKIFDRHGLTDKDYVVGIHLGAGGSGRSNRPWRMDGYAAVINALSKEYKLKWILTGGEHEKKLAAELLRLVEPQAVVIDLTGKTSLSQLVAIIKRYDLYMSVDTGPMHIAAALKRPVLLISPTKGGKPCWWGPWDTRQMIVRKRIKCPLPCVPSQCRKDSCLQDIGADEVIAAARTLLEGQGNLAREDIFADWCRKSFNILVIDTEGGKYISFAQKLQEQGLNALYHKPKAFRLSTTCWREILELLIQNDINIIHLPGCKAPWWLKLAAMRAALANFNRPLVIDASSAALFRKGEEEQNIDWLACYISAYKK